MKCVVTGAAGFIGSHLSGELLRAGHEVVGIDAFIPYYPRAIKERNQADLLPNPRYHFVELDLRHGQLEGLVADADVVFHLAAMAGLLRSWTHFDDYLTCNLQATQRLLETIRQKGPQLKRFLYASTSSVYGEFASGDEQLATNPVSPYGVTKLAAESLCQAYRLTYGVPLVVLRYFSVYGPRQRPDMGYHRFIQALLRDEPLIVYGDGQQVRGNTFVRDCVAATVAAVEADPGEIYNVGGGETASVWDIIRKIEAVSGRRAKIGHEPARPGDQRSTLADTIKLRKHLGWQPQTRLDDGLAQQWQWQKQEWEQGQAASRD
jgi:nucleoside-diphosphate-sugar epimerase